MGRFWFGILALSLYFWDSKSMGDELEGVKMPEQVRVGDHSLKLNGMALRKVYKFGIPVKVYVAGLYLQEPSHDWEKIVADGRPKYLEMEFLRTLERTRSLTRGKRRFSPDALRRAIKTKVL